VTSDPAGRALIAAIVLAAGESTRMGRQKLTLPMPDGRPLVRVAVERVLATAPDETVVVLGRDAEAIAQTLSGLPVRTVVNPRYAEGQSTSLRAGLDALGPDTVAAVVALGDQPSQDPGVIRRLIAAFHATARPIVVPVYRNGRGNPVLFAAALFDELRAVTGDRGGRDVIARDPARVAEVAVDMPMPADVDTPADYEAVRRGREDSGGPATPR
jgi:molybdenum cofactor cytidylyltransferase